MLSKKHLHFSSMQVRGAAGERTMEEMTGPDWAGVLLKLRGVTVLYTASYLTSGIGAGGTNVKKLASMMKKILELGLPFIIMADWNMQPDELRETGFLQQTGGEVIVPQGVRSTCNSGRLLEFAVVRTRLRPMVKSLKPMLHLPWSTHVGLRMQLSRAPRQAMVRQLCTPRSIREKGGDDRTTPTPPGMLTARWDRRGKNFDTGIQGKQQNQLEGTVLRSIEEDAWEVGAMYAKWSRKLEDYLLESRRKKEDSSEAGPIGGSKEMLMRQ